MPMDTEELTDALLETQDAIRILTAGCQELAGAIGTQTTMLTAILEAVTAEPEGESPIVVLLKRLVEVSEVNAAALNRIEQAVAR
jgi:hypothetical protein